jgi:hypothetical protein
MRGDRETRDDVINMVSAPWVFRAVFSLGPLGSSEGSLVTGRFNRAGLRSPEQGGMESVSSGCGRGVFDAGSARDKIKLD